MNELTIKDGFNFGCGFFIAAFVYSVVMFLIVGVLGVLLSGGLLASLINLSG